MNFPRHSLAALCLIALCACSKTEQCQLAVWIRKGPAVEKAKAANPSLGREALVDEAIKANVWQAIEDTLRESETLRKHAIAGKVKVVGALYDIEKGTVTWLGNHPDQAKILAGQ